MHQQRAGRHIALMSNSYRRSNERPRLLPTENFKRFPPFSILPPVLCYLNKLTTHQFVASHLFIIPLLF
ncbi:hypothetical protein BDFB_001843 [Asbolus verrucosus]|uniref:Uncharacterized protein n=1 Tax=Asbolus verrucosus TaxID=1661398 RepID=A0A482VGK3_ASBVE|nr:hypothetical protein BDFB_001843 [Asbolus verrucosus]